MFIKNRSLSNITIASVLMFSCLISCAGNVKNKKEMDIIDAYRIRLAYAVQDNWKEPDFKSTVSMNLQSDIVFSVHPDGQITDIFVFKHSGNELLDQSAISAIEKTSPFDPYPSGISTSVIRVGLRFTPKGVK